MKCEEHDYRTPILDDRLVVLEFGLGLESGLKSSFAGLGLGLELKGLGLGLGLKSFFSASPLSSPLVT